MALKGRFNVKFMSLEALEVGDLDGVASTKKRTKDKYSGCCHPVHRDELVRAGSKALVTLFLGYRVHLFYMKQ